MKILYISVHEALEYDECKLFTELGHDVFSLGGAYSYPSGHPSLKRPGIPEMVYHEEWDQQSRLFPRTEIPESFLNNFDVIVIMHAPDVLSHNWPRFRGRKVIWRSIGQSTRGVEEQLVPLRHEGLKIVRYSPKEANIPRYVGEDAMIRFYKDPSELGEWNGHDKTVISFVQTLKGRRVFCHYDHMMEMVAGLPGRIYGSGNEDLGGLNGGELTWDLMKGKLRDSRVFLYAGTWPASYSLSFMEAMMTGIPMVCIGKRLAQEIPGCEYIDFYEVEDIIKNGENGFVSDDIRTLRSYVFQLLNDDELAKRISEKGRETAIELFGKEKIAQQWRELFASL